jgi:hypothetical protein
VAGLERGLIFVEVGSGVELADGGEKVMGERLVKGKRGWELDEEWAEFGAEAGGFVEECLEKRAGVGELGFVGDGTGEFDGEAEVGRSGGGPALPGLAEVRAVEAGVDFDAVEAVGVALEVGKVGVSGWRKGGRVIFRERPAGGADVDVPERRRVG